jgi:hypothetical protein
VVPLTLIIVGLALFTTLSFLEPATGARIQGYIRSKWRGYTGADVT